MIPFIKMQGCGNDFVVLDARSVPLPRLDFARIADRHFGIGCDQVIILERAEGADVKMRIVNADGSEVNSCGNASRCVGWLIAQEKPGIASAKILTNAGIVEAFVSGSNVRVDMGAPRLEWNEIPLSHKEDTLHLSAAEGDLKDAVGVSMGNPHAVFFVKDANAVKLEALGPKLEHNALFPERANIGVAEVIDAQTINLRVWERGSGLTLACGTGACAALVAACRRGLTGRKATVELPGGALQIEWRESDNHVFMTGEVATSFTGEFDAKLYSV